VTKLSEKEEADKTIEEDRQKKDVGDRE